MGFGGPLLSGDPGAYHTCLVGNKFLHTLGMWFGTTEKIKKKTVITSTYKNRCNEAVC